MTDRRRPGRPRSEEARRAILAAAREELDERGYGNLTIEGIAARAGVGKQTIYRWWSSKGDVVMDAALDLAATQISAPDEGSLQADLTRFLSGTYRLRDRARPVLMGLVAQSLLDPAFATEFRERFIAGRRLALRAVLERAVARGEIDAGQDLELLLDVVYGVLWYRLLFEHAPLDDQAARDLAALVTRAALAN